jgi:AbrB family looped-hinge helix DNA binding protein
METTKLSSKGQVVLPRAIRAAKAWAPGQALAVVSTAEGVLLKPIKAFKETRFEDVAGCLRYKGKAKTLEEMDAAVAAEARRRK